jgi:lipopolysaccharide/colanic/teichoic acid biosynthesis glycosyltransferase
MQAVAQSPSSTDVRTIWGLDPQQLHNRYWAAHGVQVVRQGEPSQIIPHAELYLLTDPRSLCIFPLSRVIDILNWIEPDVLFVRIHDLRERGYREYLLTDESDRFVRFQRVYDRADRLARVVLTPDREVARLWQMASDPLSGWRRLRRFTPRIERVTVSVDGLVYDRTSDRELAAFVHDLVRDWKRPDATIDRARKHNGTWIDPTAGVDPSARIIGPVWIGAGRKIERDTTVIGPAVVWDAPEARPESQAIEWLAIEPLLPPAEAVTAAELTPLSRTFKRLFDIGFSIVALCLTLPLYPLIMLAIWLDDGRPFFFWQWRETTGGRKFKCLKFRSMFRDSEKTREKIKNLNQADGAQFYIENDPRVTRVGRFLRKSKLDELPQFLNILAGHMSVVGPRPLAEHENQFNPTWRETRLSVRPGITGLWQIQNTRRSGKDFQEWIKYDIEYVEKASLWLDLKIIWRTIVMVVRKSTWG